MENCVGVMRYDFQFWIKILQFSLIIISLQYISQPKKQFISLSLDYESIIDDHFNKLNNKKKKKNTPI